MGKIIASANQKGGVGKTTTAINLSSCMAIAEKTVLLVDIDPQANATSGLGVNPEEQDISSYEIILSDAKVNDAILKSNVPFLDIMPSHIRLVGAEVELVNINDREQKLKMFMIIL